MFGFNQIAATVSGIFGQGGQAPDAISGGLADLAQAVNVDPGGLQNLPVDDVNTTLIDAGVDPANLADGQIVETAQQLLEAGGMEPLNIGQLLGKSGS